MAALTSVCKNCQQNVTTAFCGHCGQQVLHQRQSFRLLWQHIVTQVFSLDRGLVRTALELLKKPGNMIRNYLDGKTITSTPPVR